MEPDFKSLRILLVGGNAAGLQVLRTAFGMLGIRELIAVQQSARAIDVLRANTFGAIFCDAFAERVDKLAFPLAARQAAGVLNPMTPLFLVHSQPRRHNVEAARDAGVTDVIGHPVSAATIERKLAAAIQSPRPFIAAPTFFGPDRRTRGLPWYGPERRTRIARKTKFSAPSPSGAEAE